MVLWISLNALLLVAVWVCFFRLTIWAKVPNFCSKVVQSWRCFRVAWQHLLTVLVPEVVLTSITCDDYYRHELLAPCGRTTDTNYWHLVMITIDTNYWRLVVGRQQSVTETQLCVIGKFRIILWSKEVWKSCIVCHLVLGASLFLY